MNVLGSGMIQNLYERYKKVEVTYNAQVTEALGYLPKDASLKIQGNQYPCLLHSMSFDSAKLILGVPLTKLDSLKDGAKLAILRLAFLGSRSGAPEAYQISGSLTVTQTRQNTDQSAILILEMSFNHRPQDGLLEIQGGYLDLQKDARQRHDERIPITDASALVLGLLSRNSTITVDAIPRKCLVRELSYGGAKIILTGLAQFLGDKNFELELVFAEEGKMFLPGQVVRSDPVEGHKELAVLGLRYSPEKVPMGYLTSLQRGLKRGMSEPAPTPIADASRTVTRRESVAASIDPTTLKIIPGRHR